MIDMVHRAHRYLEGVLILIIGIMSCELVLVVLNQTQLMKKKKKLPKLSEKEETEYRAAGKCFNCGETGYISRNCPHQHSVKGTRGSKPPGVPSYCYDTLFTFTFTLNT